MEKQNINLVLSLPARQSMYLSFRFVKVIFASAFGFLVAIYFLFYVINWFRSAELQKLTKERAALTNEVSQIIEASKKSTVSETLVASVANLKSKIASQERVVRLLKTQQQSRFSNFLETLSKEIPNNVWLTEMKVVPEKEYVSLIGYALDASSVSVFVRQLSDSAIYSPYLFKSVDVSDTKENYFRFVISTEKEVVNKNKSAA